MTEIHEIFDEIQRYRSSGKNNPELRTDPNGWFEVITSNIFLVPISNPVIRKGRKNYVGHFAGIPVVLDPDLSSGTWIIRESVCDFCLTPIDWERDNCQKCGAPYD
jgi:hypothetical protein